MTITTPELTTRRRNSAVILTDRICQKRTSTRIKIYDRKCPGLYVSIIPAGVATFSFKFFDPATGKQRSTTLGVYSPAFTVEDARSQVYALKAMDKSALVEQLRQTKAAKGKHGKTVAEIVKLRIEWMKQLELKQDGQMRKRIESWSNVASHLNRFVVPKLGNKIASDVTKDDIAELSNDILDGKFGVPSRSNARHARRAVSGLYAWSAEPGRVMCPRAASPPAGSARRPRSIRASGC
jgi:hypothetical protein